MNSHMLIGFSTGCLYQTHPRIGRETLDVISKTGANAIELMCSGEADIDKIFTEIEAEDLERFQYISIHAPVFRNFPDIDISSVLDKLKKITEKFPIKNITVHAGDLIDLKIFSRYELPWGIENEDFKQEYGKSVADISEIFSKLDAALVLDANHCFTNDPSMKLAGDFIEAFRGRIRQVHLSGYEKFHEPLFRTDQKIILDSISGLDVPIIIESGCQEVGDMQNEYDYVTARLNNH